MLKEGVYDPNILKAVFLAGGPGSGKSYSVNQIFGVDDVMKSTSAIGLKVVNSDPAFEMFLKKSGVNPKNLSKMTDKVFQYYTSKSPSSVRSKAKATKDKLQAIYENGRLGLIIDGTGANYPKIAKQMKRLSSLGYDCSMVFVNTSLPIALKRNSQRERVLPDHLVQESWEAVQHNMGKFQSLFGGNFLIVDNSEIGDFSKMHKNKISAAMKLVKKPVKNKIGRQWIQNQMKLKSLSEALIIEQQPLSLGKQIGLDIIVESITQEDLDLFISENITAGAHVDDGPTTWYQSTDHFKQEADEMAEKLGMKVLDYVMNDGDLESFKSDREVNGTTFFNAGVPGETTPTNPLDFKNSEAYPKWKALIKKLATQMGVKFLTFKDSDVAGRQKTPQGVKVAEPLKEGVSDKHIFKCVFLAGGPGSGKSTVVNQLFNNPSRKSIKSLTSTGLKVVNLDQAYEYLKKKHKLPASSDDFTDEERSLDGKLMGKARKLSQKQMDIYLDGKLGIIIDGTGASSNALFQKKKRVEDLGYDTYMVYVDTSLETALARNAARTERKLLDKVVERSWQKVHDNLSVFKNEFGSNFVKISTDSDVTDSLPSETKAQVMKFINKPVKNKEAKKWLSQAKKL